MNPVIHMSLWETCVLGSFMVLQRQKVTLYATDHVLIDIQQGAVWGVNVGVFYELIYSPGLLNKMLMYHHVIEQ